VAWTDPIEDLRNLINDGATDHERWRKRCVGQVDSTNVAFKTWEKRRLTDFTSPTATLGVFVTDENGVTTIETAATDDVALGQFTLSTAPAPGSIVEATYYYQWFTDDQLDEFLISSSNWLALGDNYSNIETGLRPAALHYGAQSAMHKQAQYFAENVSDVYLMQEGPKETKVGVINHYRQMADDFRKKSIELRDNFYAGSGQQNKPYNVSIMGRVKEIVPKR